MSNRGRGQGFYGQQQSAAGNTGPSEWSPYYSNQQGQGQPQQPQQYLPQQGMTSIPQQGRGFAHQQQQQLPPHASAHNSHNQNFQAGSPQAYQQGQGLQGFQGPGQQGLGFSHGTYGQQMHQQFQSNQGGPGSAHQQYQQMNPQPVSGGFHVQPNVATAYQPVVQTNTSGAATTRLMYDSPRTGAAADGMINASGFSRPIESPSLGNPQMNQIQRGVPQQLQQQQFRNNFDTGNMAPDQRFQMQGGDFGARSDAFSSQMGAQYSQKASQHINQRVLPQSIQVGSSQGGLNYSQHGTQYGNQSHQQYNAFESSAPKPSRFSPPIMAPAIASGMDSYSLGLGNGAPPYSPTPYGGVANIKTSEHVSLQHQKFPSPGGHRSHVQALEKYPANTANNYGIGNYQAAVYNQQSTGPESERNLEAMRRSLAETASALLKPKSNNLLSSSSYPTSVVVQYPSRPLDRRSRSPPQRRMRSRSPPDSKKRPRDSKRDSNLDTKPKRDRRSKSRSRSRSKSPVGNALRSNSRKVDLSMAPRHLSSLFNTPTLSERQSCLTTLDLAANFPRLYVPADFCKIELDWLSMHSCMGVGGMVSRMSLPVPHIIESPSALAASVAKHLQVDKPTKGTQMEATLSDGRICPIKFNCKVICSFGVRAEDESLPTDHLLPRRLRLLCGRRKGAVHILGGAWSQELDGGDPINDRSCLLNTVVRTLKALTFCDLSRCAHFSKLFDITYHRPEETYEGKFYPEIEEVTAVYNATLFPPEYTEEEFTAEWDLFQRRTQGLDIGHRLAPASEAPVVNETKDSCDICAEVTQIVEIASDQASFPGGLKEEESKVESAEIPGAILSDVQLTHNPCEVENEKIPTESKEESIDDILDKAIDDILDEVKGVFEDVSCSGAGGDVTLLSTIANTVAATEPPAARVKPAAPIVLVCPQPLPKEILDDPEKKLDATTLRLVSLSSILAYSLEDRHERLFEASITGEVLLSLFSTTYAHIITDVLLATSPALAILSNERVRDAVYTLLASKTAKLEASKINTTDSHEEGEVSEDAKDLKRTLPKSDIEAIPEPAHEAVPVVPYVVDGGAFTNEFTAVRSLFLDACRWFDSAEDRLLRADHLRLIITCSNR